jgi:hypothetical protein
MIDYPSFLLGVVAGIIIAIGLRRMARDYYKSKRERGGL